MGGEAGPFLNGEKNSLPPPHQLPVRHGPQYPSLVFDKLDRNQTWVLSKTHEVTMELENSKFLDMIPKFQF